MLYIEKNETENFYYVYTNPKKTTLIRETDMVFVLSSTDNIIAIYEKNLVDVNAQQKNNDLFSNEDNIINIEKSNQHFIKAFQEAVESQLKEGINNNKKKDSIIINKNSFEAQNIKNALFSNLFKDKGRERKSTINRRSEEKEIFIQKGKYTEIDNLQNKLDKAMEKLRSINSKSKNIEKDVDYFVKEEISSELSIYVTKTGKK